MLIFVATFLPPHSSSRCWVLAASHNLGPSVRACRSSSLFLRPCAKIFFRRHRPFVRAGHLRRSSVRARRSFSAVTVRSCVQISTVPPSVREDLFPSSPYVHACRSPPFLRPCAKILFIPTVHPSVRSCVHILPNFLTVFPVTHPSIGLCVHIFNIF